MLKFKSRLLLLQLLCSFSLICFSSNKDDNEFKLPVQTTHIKTLKGEIAFPELFLGVPHRLLIVKNNLLISDGYEGKQMTLVDLSNPKNNKRIISKGQGPNEFFRLSNVSYHAPNNEICLYDGDTGYVRTYKVKNKKVEIDGQTLVSSVRMKDLGVKYVLPFGEQYLSRGAFEDKQLALFDKEGKRIAVFGVYPGNNDGVASPESFFLKTQGEIAASPDQKYFVVAGFHHDQLTFYKATESIPLKVKEYFSEEPKVKAGTEVSGGTTYYTSGLEPNSRIVYYDIYPTNNTLYALYWGIKDSEMDGDVTNEPCAVLAFNWDGTLRKAYKIPHLIKAIAIDDINNCLYGLKVTDEDPLLMKYKL